MAAALTRRGLQSCAKHYRGNIRHLGTYSDVKQFSRIQKYTFLIGASFSTVLAWKILKTKRLYSSLPAVSAAAKVCVFVRRLDLCLRKLNPKFEL